MKKMINEVHLEGYLYEHNLEVKVTGKDSKAPGTEYLRGSISVATDEECLNVVQVFYTYVTPVTAKGKVNAAYNTLKNIYDGTIKTVMGHGKENAAKVRIDTAIALNEFWSDRNGTEEFVSVKRNEGGFIHLTDNIVEDEKERNKFKVDMVITGVRRVEGDPEQGTEDKVIVKGAIFNFANALLPIELTAKNPAAMEYFEGLEASSKNPTFTKLWGRQISTTIVKEQIEESAFGEASVKKTTTSYKDFVITGAQTDPYVWDDESSITVAEMNEKVSAREITLATIKQRYEDNKNRNQTPAVTTAPTIGGFNF